MQTFKIPGEPPRVTAQQKKIAVVNGKPRMYAPKRLKEAQDLYYIAAKANAPAEPIEGPISLRVEFYFGTSEKKKRGAWKTTRPDMDNMVKALTDAMTRAGWWHDDSQICAEHIYKLWVGHETACTTVSVDKL